ncbi:Protein kinase [Colletotrichum asianum]
MYVAEVPIKNLASRVAEESDDKENYHDPSILSKLPFSEATWSHVLDIFHVHGSAAKLINRARSCVFSRTPLTLNGTSTPMIVYNCRSSSSWPEDLALSMTWFPGRKFWYAIFYGCDKAIENEIAGRIRSSEDAICHPLLLPGIFAELERRRHLKMVRNASDTLMETVTGLNNNHRLASNLSRAPKHGVNSTPWQDSEQAPGTDREVDPWLDIVHMKNGLENWKEQLAKMVAHADELNTTKFSHDVSQDPTTQAFHSLMRDNGRRIKERLQDIIHEYDEKIRDCNRNLDGMTLANQVAHTKVNMEIASRTKEDSTQMKSIALLTMVFLPATFLATVFSMSFFNWQPDSEKGEAEVSPKIWIYAVIAGIVTLMTLLAWYWFIKGRHAWRARQQLGEENEPSVYRV